MTDTLNLIEIYPSIQGETSYIGLPTTIIRTAACNLRCSWCDSAYTFGRGTPTPLTTILEQVNTFQCPYVCVTGGEPLLQPAVHPLMTTLCNRNYRVSIETGGSLPTQMIDPRVKTILDIKCPGSGMEGKNHWPNLETLRPHDEIKFVLADRADYTFAKEICAKHNLFRFEVLFSPVHDQLDPPVLVQWILDDHLPVRLNLQIHKYIWTKATQGV